MKGSRAVPAFLLLIILTAYLAGCGSSGTTTASGGIGGTGISSGPITGFGSVIVNGVEFSTTGASILQEGSPSDESELRVGMVVTVQGIFDANGTTGTASQIDFYDNLEGPIQSIVDPQTLLILGQTVRVNSGTHYDSEVNGATVTGLNDLQAGNVIEVSGFPQTDGSIVASFIELKSTVYTQGDEIEVKGFISNLDMDTFQIGSLVVNYSSATLNPPGLVLSNGIYVEVQSTLGFDSNTGDFIATQVEGLSSSLPSNPGSKVELEGFITQFVSPTDFRVNGQPVSTTSSTRYEPATASAADLAPNVRVEVEGTMDSAGTIIAHQISFENEDGSESTDD